MIDAIDLLRLRNGEFLQFATNFSALVESNDPIALNVLKQHNDFKVAISVIEPLFKVERVNAITQQLVLFDERRDKAVTGLVTVIDGFCFHFNAMVAQAAKLLAADLLLFGAGVARQNYPAETALINGIINDWETKPELAGALALLGIEDWKDELKTANQVFDQKYLERVKEYGAANPDTLKEKREETMNVYYELRKYLDANSVLHNTPDYEKTINELNALIGQYNTLLNARLKEPVIKTAPVVN